MVGGKGRPFEAQDKCTLQVFDFDWLDVSGGFESEDFGVEVEFAVYRCLDVLGATESVLFAFEFDVGDGEAFVAKDFDHHLRLIWRHDLVLQALEERNRA